MEFTIKRILQAIFFVLITTSIVNAHPTNQQSVKVLITGQSNASSLGNQGNILNLDYFHRKYKQYANDYFGKSDAEIEGTVIAYIGSALLRKNT